MAGTIPTTLESLSTTAASNDPTEGSGAAMTLVNDGLRAAYAFIRQTVTAGSDIASASTITPPSTGSSFNLTGTTTVTAIGSTNSWDGRIVWFRHTGAHSFTNSATLVCLGGASITFASGDISAWRQRIPGTWDQLVMSRGDGAFLGDSWSVDSSGRLLNGGNTQVSFSASRSTDQTSGQTVIFDTEGHDQGGCYNNSTGVFTAPVAGSYIICTNVFALNNTGATASLAIQITKNGTSTVVNRLYLPTIGASGTTAGDTSFVIRLAANDTLQVYSPSTVFNASGWFIVANNAWFSGQLLG